MFLEFRKEIRKNLGEAIEAHKEQLISSTAEDYSQYRYIQGRVHALMDVENLIEDITEKFNDGEIDD